MLDSFFIAAEIYFSPSGLALLIFTFGGMFMWVCIFGGRNDDR